MKQLLEAGVHFGHQTRRWNPKMARYIFTERNGIYIIDLQKTRPQAREVYRSSRSMSRRGKTRSCSSARRSRRRTPSAKRPSAPACPTSTSAGSAACSPTSRPSKSASRVCSELERMQRGPARSTCCRRKRQPASKDELEQLEQLLGGIKDMTRLPGALFIVDPRKERIAVAEARKLEDPDHRHRRHELRSRRDRLRHPGQRRRHPRRQAA